MRRLTLVCAMLVLLAWPGVAAGTAIQSPPWAHLHSTGTTDGNGTGKLRWATPWMTSMGYTAYDFPDLSAVSTYDCWKKDAVFIFAGHGLADGDTGALGGGLVCNKNDTGYILANDMYYPSRVNGTYQYFNPPVTRETYFIKNFGSADVNQCNVAMFIGCGTSQTSPRFGNLLDWARWRGVDCAIGFDDMNFLEAEGVFGMGFIRGAWSGNLPVDSPLGFNSSDADLMQSGWVYMCANTASRPLTSPFVTNLADWVTKGQYGTKLAPAAYGDL